jgi:N6-adenosine-specific RNA methylase IME4
VSKYSVILADPPWNFETWGEGDRNVTKYYAVMPTDDICKLSIPAEKNSVLFMWACWPKLKDAMQVIEAWGFEYKTIAWVWAKLNKNSMGFFHGMGYYTRANTEPCLLATRGKMPKPQARDVQALICSPVRQHSRKPDEQYEKIERLYPCGPYLEMFARHTRPGWDVWGHQVQSTVSISTSAPNTGMQATRSALPGVSGGENISEHPSVSGDPAARA